MKGSKTKISNNTKRVLGIWDLHLSPLTIGGLLFFIVELQIQKLLYNCKSTDICFVGTTDELSSSGKTILNPIDTTGAKTKQLSTPLLILKGMKGIENYFQCPTKSEFQKFIHENDKYITWPTFDKNGNTIHKYGTVFFCQNFFHEKGFVPQLSCNDNYLKWANNFLKSNIFPDIPVAVHLKNNRNSPGKSNADFNAWFEFLNQCCRKNPQVKFILIGNENVDPRIIKLSNVIVSRNYRCNLLQDLAIIQTSSMFMGMSSGPCNLALFSSIPYVIYKNPDHDAEEMDLALGNNDKLSFAGPYQKMIRAFETVDNLILNFSHLIESIN